MMTGVGMLVHNVNGDQGPSRQLLVLAHQIVSVIFIASPLLLVVFKDKRVWRENLKLIGEWSAKDLEWLVKKPMTSVSPNIQLPPADKFNPGQKVWAILSISGSAVLFITGVVMWLTPSPILAIMEHTAVALCLMAALAGHVFMAIGNKETRESINSIIHGKVDAMWAHHHHPVWMERESRRIRHEGARHEGSEVSVITHARQAQN